MAKLRSISTAIWSDTWFEELTASEKLLFVYLITNDRVNMLGVYEISFRKISFETSIPSETIRKALEGFERANKIKYVDNHVVLINYLKHQNFNFNMMKSAIDAYNELPNSLKIKGLEGIKERDKKGFESLCKGFGMLRKVEVEVEVEKEDETEESNGLLDDVDSDPLIEKTTAELMKFFDFIEINNFNQLRDVNQALSVLSSNKRLEYFIEQFHAYGDYKAKTGEKRHGFKGFLGTLEEKFEDGGWNAENWAAKLKSFKPDQQQRSRQTLEELGYKKFE